MNEIREALSVMTERLKERGEKGTDSPEEWGSERKEGAPQEPVEEEDEKERTENAAGSFLVKNAVSYIEEHCSDKLKLSDVADQVYVSQWHLSKLLNRYLGQNFSEILNGIRIEKAKEMLKDPALRIGDIAEKVGFSDMAYLGSFLQ